MTHFGILCPAGTGHLNLMTTLSNELLPRGHRVTVFNLLNAQDQTLAAGLQFQPIAEDDFSLCSIATSLTQMKRSNLAALRYHLKSDQKKLAAILRDAPTAIQQIEQVGASGKLLFVDSNQPRKKHNIKKHGS